MIPSLTILTDKSSSHPLVVRVIEKGASPDELPADLVEDAAHESVVTYLDGQRSGFVVIEEGRDMPERARVAGGKAAALAAKLKMTSFALDLAALPEDLAGPAVEGALLGSYRFDDYRSKKEEEGHPQEVAVILPEKKGNSHSEHGHIEIAAGSTGLARDLVNRSPHEKTAPMLAEAVRAMCDEVGLTCEILDERAIEAERMGGLLAVNRGSVEPPRFVIVEHRPEGVAGDSPVVLVGKAVVFDTGGLSLKPTKDSMDQMKADMAGGAAVIGAMRAIAEMELPLHVVALIPMTDNRPGGNAYVPGDVVTMRSGHTVEVLNTDAEGRMLLADALDYAKKYSPSLVVDVATLTGAAVIALGTHVAAILTAEDDDHDKRLAPFIEAGRATGEWVHPLPTADHFAEHLKSDVADLKNVGGREAGTITAAKFLQRFTEDEDGDAAYPWVHLDIAGPAFITSARPYRPAGGTGFGVRLLVETLRRLAE